MKVAITALLTVWIISLQAQVNTNENKADNITNGTRSQLHQPLEKKKGQMSYIGRDVLIGTGAGLFVGSAIFYAAERTQTGGLIFATLGATIGLFTGTHAYQKQKVKDVIGARKKEIKTNGVLLQISNTSNGIGLVLSF